MKQPGRSQRAEYFVCRDVMKTKRAGVCLFAPVLACDFKQDTGANDVGINKIGGAVYRTIDMRFSREMHDGVRLELDKQVPDRHMVADITPLKVIA